MEKMEHDVAELKQLVKKQQDDITALVTTVSILKKKIDHLSDENESLQMRLSAAEDVIEGK